MERQWIIDWCNKKRSFKGVGKTTISINRSKSGHTTLYGENRHRYRFYFCQMTSDSWDLINVNFLIEIVFAKLSLLSCQWSEVINHHNHQVAILRKFHLKVFAFLPCTSPPVLATAKTDWAVLQKRHHNSHSVCAANKN